MTASSRDGTRGRGTRVNQRWSSSPHYSVSSPSPERRQSRCQIPRTVMSENSSGNETGAGRWGRARFRASTAPGSFPLPPSFPHHTPSFFTMAPIYIPIPEHLSKPVGTSGIRLLEIERSKASFSSDDLKTYLHGAEHLDRMARVLPVLESEVRTRLPSDAPSLCSLFCFTPLPRPFPTVVLPLPSALPPSMTGCVRQVRPALHGPWREVPFRTGQGEEARCAY